MPDLACKPLSRHANNKPYMPNLALGPLPALSQHLVPPNLHLLFRPLSTSRPAQSPHPVPPSLNISSRPISTSYSALTQHLVRPISTSCSALSKHLVRPISIIAFRPRSTSRPANA